MKKLFTCLMLMVGMLLPLTATAADLKADLTIYYDVSDFGDFSGNKLQLMVGHDSYSIAYEMKAVEGYDNLYSVNIGDVNSGNSWGGANQLGIMAATSVWGSENSSPTHRFSYTSLKTGIYKLTKNLSGNVLFTGKSTLSITENYTLPVKDPVINVGTLSQFPATTVNETSTATLTYKVENSDETAKVTVEGEGFTAEDVAGTITITFAPTEAKEYTATLTIAIGDIKETVDLVATGVAADAPKVPEILNLAAGEIAEIFAGETTEFEVTYTLLNAEEATASIEGEGFTIKKQEVGTATIEFAPTEAKTYEAVVTVTSGETIKTLEISATAKNAPTKITITYVNTEGYENVYIHAWGGTASATAWPGQQLTATGNQINGYDTYSFTFEEGAYVSCLFNCGVNPDACKTGDQTIDASKTYFSKGTWYATAEEIPAEVPDVWTVVGAEGLFETAWDFGNVAYDMTEGEGGIYTLVIDEVALDATDYAYKFVQNRSWSGAQYPQVGDYTLTVAEAASYKVTYTLDTNAGNGTCTIEKVTSPEPDPEPEPTPEITVSETEVDFGEITVGEQANKEVTYTYKDTEKPEISLVGNGFSYTDNEESIIITFAPVDAGEYEGTLTVGKAELAKTITLKGTAKAAVDPEKPELIVSTEEVVFETLILDGEQFSSTETITYEIRNSDEEAVIALESEVFKAEDENGTITITFTPTFRNASYKATLTITLGDIVKTVAISAVVKPLIDDIILPEFDDTKVGEYEEIEVLYSLHKGNEGEARIDDDEAFKITSQKVGQIFIRFTPLEAKEYTTTLIITSGKFVREITLIANGLAPDPEPVVITFVDEVTFPKTFVGETTNDIIEFTLNNAAEDAEVVVEVTGEAFSVAEVQDNFIFLAFAPEAEGEYAGVLTVTVGEVSESLEFTAVASPVEPDPEPEPTPEYPKTITVKVACAWETCNIWAWYADESGNVYTEWPGEAMTKGEDGFYAIEMSIESPVYFKVNAGLGKTESENYMTEVSESTCFNMDGLKLVVNEDCEYEEPVKIEPYYAIRGLTGSWEMADEIKLTEDADKAEWYITNIEVDGTQEFKVVYVDETGAATWYGAGAVEANEALGKFGEGEENIKLAAGKYDIYFKVNEGMMWIQFSAETPTDVEDAAAELIYAVDGTIIAPAPFAIIDLAGKDVTKANGSLQGTYIVKTLNSVTKVSVQ